MLAISFVPAIKPVRPFIQLPGEVYPGTEWFFGGWTNTFTATLFAWITVVIIALSLRARSRTADEVPTGFYNFFEMVIEGAYGFAENIAGAKKVKDFFPFFMTYILVILVANWWGLIPGVDSIGIWEPKPVFEAHNEERAVEAEILALYEEGGDAAVEARLDALNVVYGLDADHALEHDHGHLTEDSIHAVYEYVKKKVDAENKGDLQNGLLLQRAYADEDGNKPENADYTIVPFLRPAATDLNFTIAFAVIAMVMVQYYGFAYLGARDYLSKFFPFISPTFGQDVSDNPIRAIDIVVGLLELVSEISKVISFAFRLLGNIFAGMVLLFVMSFLLPVANIAFYGLEFFVGLIQALVFALLMLIFMVSATESHHGDDHAHDDHH